MVDPGASGYPKRQKSTVVARLFRWTWVTQRPPLARWRDKVFFDWKMGRTAGPHSHCFERLFSFPFFSNWDGVVQFFRWAYRKLSSRYQPTEQCDDAGERFNLMVYNAYDGNLLFEFCRDCLIITIDCHPHCARVCGKGAGDVVGHYLPDLGGRYAPKYPPITN